MNKKTEIKKDPKKAPLADISIDEEDQLELEDIMEMHRKAGKDDNNIQKSLIEDEDIEMMDIDLENLTSIGLDTAIKDEEEIEIMIPKIEFKQEPEKEIKDNIFYGNESDESPKDLNDESPFVNLKTSGDFDVELSFIKDKFASEDHTCITSWGNFDLLTDIKAVKFINKKITDILNAEVDEYLLKLTKIFDSEAKVHELYKKLESLAQRRSSVNELLSTSQQIAVERGNIEVEKMQPEEIKATLNNIANIKKIINHYEMIFKKLDK